jgi:hypothetical protein
MDAGEWCMHCLIVNCTFTYIARSEEHSSFSPELYNRGLIITSNLILLLILLEAEPLCPAIARFKPIIDISHDECQCDLL